MENNADNRILMIHCGGTLGMVKTANGYKTMKGYFKKLIRSSKVLNENSPCNFINQYKMKIYSDEKDDNVFYTDSVDEKPVCYELYELKDIIDSAEADLDDWVKLIQLIESVYNKYKGFVIVHGTDTIAYASSFLSFMIEDLTKPIIFTGAMEPMDVNFRVAENNLLRSLQVANSDINPGVYLWFENYLHKGWSVTKRSTYELDAFWSKDPASIENLPLNKNRENLCIKPTFHYKYENSIGIVKIHPGMSLDYFIFMLGRYKCIILESFGSGNGLGNRKDILYKIKAFVAKGGLLINKSQAIDGYVNFDYFSCVGLSKAGAISGKGMTCEAIFCKIAFLLGNAGDSNLAELFSTDILGEYK